MFTQLIHHPTSSVCPTNLHERIDDIYPRKQVWRRRGFAVSWGSAYLSWSFSGSRDSSVLLVFPTPLATSFSVFRTEQWLGSATPQNPTPLFSLNCRAVHVTRPLFLRHARLSQYSSSVGSISGRWGVVYDKNEKLWSIVFCGVHGIISRKDLPRPSTAYTVLLHRVVTRRFPYTEFCLTRSFTRRLSSPPLLLPCPNRYL